MRPRRSARSPIKGTYRSDLLKLVAAADGPARPEVAALKKGGRSVIRSRVRAALTALCLAALAASGPTAQPAPGSAVQQLIGGAQFKQAAAFIQSDYDRFVRELVALTEIPAPPFKEQARAKAFAGMLRERRPG